MEDYLYFITIIEKGSISKAAEELYISQPSLSKYLKKLEHKIGYTLIDRTSYPLTLTDEGKVFYEFVQQNIERQMKLEKDLADVSNNIAGTINFGLTVWRSSIVIPYVFPNFNQLYPQIKLNLFEGSHQYLMSLLNNGQTDFSLMHIPNSFSGLKYKHIIQEDILFVVNKNNPILSNFDFNLNKVNKMSINDFIKFKNEKFILLKEGQNIRELAELFFRFIDFTPNIILDTSNMVTALNLVSYGFGVTFAPALTIRDSNKYIDLVYFKVDSSYLHWDIAFGFREDVELSPISDLFIEFTIDTIKNLF